MIKKRIIFTLLFEKNSFFLSRNFRLQKIGNFDWLKKNYDFSLIANSVDEIILLNVSRTDPEIENFCEVIKIFTKECFIPISVGGKISSLEIAKKYIQSGADKLVINTNLFNIKLLNKIANTFGEQCIVGSLDYLKTNNKFVFYTKNGTKKINLNTKKIFSFLIKSPIGEVMLNSIDKDGTGNGFDFSFLKEIPKNFFKPVIYSGGAGNHNHLIEALKKKEIDSISTANLLNFVGDGLQEARKQIIKKKIKLAKWI
tara:strand:+ start:12087 stop:12854 length:768 start_codon:yes stop_codon:yes gene_type:complete